MGWTAWADLSDLSDWGRIMRAKRRGCGQDKNRTGTGTLQPLWVHEEGDSTFFEDAHGLDLGGQMALKALFLSPILSPMD